MHEDQFITESHSLWTSKKGSFSPVERQVDEMLNGFLCYPEFEWSTYDIRPPENLDLLGSWRNDVGSCFIFLLSKPDKKSPKEYDYLVIVVGLSQKVKRITELIKSHKGIVHAAEKRELKRLDIDKGLKEETSNKTIERYLKLFGIFTVVVNAFSMYLRTVPPPQNMSSSAGEIYFSIISILHISALGLLTILVLIAIIYTIRYGYMMIRRMR